MWIALDAKPGPVVETYAVDNQRISFPLTNGVSQPRGIEISRMAASVQEHLAGQVTFREYNQQRRGLNELVIHKCSGLCNGVRKAPRCGKILQIVRQPLA